MLSRKRIVTIIIILLLLIVYADLRMDAGESSWDSLFDISFSGTSSINLSSSGNYGFREEVTGQEIYSAESLEKIKIENSFGPVEIRGEDRADVVIEYVLEVRARTAETLEQAVEEVELNLLTRGSELQVSTRSPSDQDQTMVATSLKIRVPEHLSVDVTNRFDELKVENIQAQTTASIEYGPAELYNIAGPVRLNSSFADSRLEDVEGNAEIRSRYGEVTLKKIVGNVKIDSRFTAFGVRDVGGKIEGSIGYGGIRIDQVVNDVDIEANFGDISLGLPGDLSGWGFDISTKFGEINHPYDFNLESREQGERLFRSPDGGQPNLKIKAEFADVNLHQY
ncbi:MAG: DUF4097 family beta strand repeat-containing protein [Bacillota bacterium]